MKFGHEQGITGIVLIKQRGDDERANDGIVAH